MENLEQSEQLDARFEEALREAYRRPVPMDKDYMRKLDIIVGNAIEAEKAGKVHVTSDNTLKKRSFLSALFSSFKLQFTLLASFFGILCFSGIAYAAMGPLREAITPSKGTLVIATTPQVSEVLVKGGDYSDYTLLGDSPLEAKLKSGMYSILVRHEGYKDYTREFILGGGKSISYNITLEEEAKAVDKIKEWRIYSVQNLGVRFIYPQDWTLSLSDDSQSVIVQGLMSSLEFMPSDTTSEIEGEAQQLQIDGKTYTGAYDFEGSKVAVFSQVYSESNASSVKLLFKTNDEAELSIYDFILSNLAVYEVTSNSSYANWQTLGNSDIGIRFNYPTNWTVLLRTASENYTEYEVFDPAHSYDSLTVIYTPLYFSDKDEFNSLSGDSTINGLQAKKYCKDTCENGVMYVFSNKIYLSYVPSSDSAVNDIYQSIVESVSQAGESKLHVIADTKLDYKLVTTSDWTYLTVTNSSIFKDTAHGVLQNGGGELHVLRWSDISSEWDNFLSEYSGDNYTVHTKQLKINETDYVRTEIWQKVGEDYKLGIMFYSPLTSGNAQIPVVENSGNSFTFMFTAPFEVSNPSDKPQSLLDKLLEVDEIVSSIE